MSSSILQLEQYAAPMRAPRSNGDFVFVIKLVSFFAALTLALIVAAPGLLRPLFPATVALVGYQIYKRNESYYLSFALWIFMFTPLLRRMVDWRTSFQQQSLILLAPLLLSLLPAIDLRQRWARVLPVIRNGTLLTISGLVFGVGIGLIKHPGQSVFVAGAMWAAPIMLCIFVASIRDPETLSRTLKRTLLWGVLFMGSYGVYQYIVAPQWDTYWLKMVTEHAIAPSFGHPAPFAIRVWSTMNSPGSFAIVLGAALIWLATAEGPLPLATNVMGYLAFSLSLVRSAWIMTIFGLVVLALGCRKRPFFKSTISAFVILVIVGSAFLNTSRFAVVQDRFKTFTSLKSDESYDERKAMYRFMSGQILSTPLGEGLQSEPEYKGYQLDSTFVEVFFMLGWVGGGCYFAGVSYLLMHILTSLRCLSREKAGAVAVILALSTQAVSGDIFCRQSGTFFWLFIGVWACLSLRSAPARTTELEHNPMPTAAFAALDPIPLTR